MATFDETFETIKAEMADLGIFYHEELLLAVTKSLGPSIYNADSSRVACSDQTELDRVKNNFLIGKLGLEDSPTLDGAIKEVCDHMAAANRNKYRAIFYYLLVSRFNKESVFIQ